MQHLVHRSGRTVVAILACAVLGVAFVASSCVPEAPSGPDRQAGEDVDVPGPAAPLTGSVLASVETEGAASPDSLEVSLDDTEPRSIPAFGVFAWADVTPGVHLVTLGALPANCSAPDNPRQIDVEAGLQSVAAFDVDCVATTGELRITVTTSGDGSDRDGYRIDVPAADVFERVGTDAELLLTELAPGDYVVRLRDVAWDCDVEEDRVEARVVAGLRTDVVFEVRCDD